MGGFANTLPDWLDVSRETHIGLQTHLGLVLKWTQSVNLISPGTAANAWQRHVLDSAQIWYAAHVDRGLWVDVGSGGGFPGLVLAIMAREFAPDMQFLLVESDRRKAAFLRDAARQLSIPVTVRAERAESLNDVRAAVVSARALSPLTELLPLTQTLVETNGVAVFPKGQNFAQEILSARMNWSFECQVISSLVDDRSAILRIKDVHHV